MSVFWSLFLGTFILEDVALVSGVALVSQGQITASNCFWALFLGISAGDIGLYFLGLMASYFPLFSNMRVFKKTKKNFEQNTSSNWVAPAVFFSRFIPGTRVATYLFSGLVRFSFWYFFVLTVVSVFVWVLLALQLGLGLQKYLSEHLWVALLALMAVLSSIRYLIRNLKTSWTRKIFVHSWRKWMTFEFWPPWLFYIPIIPRYIYLSLKYRSFFLPFYSNPFLENAGLIGESKWDIYQHFSGDEFILKTKLLKLQNDREEIVEEWIGKGEFSFPFILKPDKGQRGFAVRVIKDKAQLSDYLSKAQFDLIVQEFCDWSHEAGIFYIRHPSAEHGEIFSITDKEFPFVTGDGKIKLGDLILKDKRARIMAATYFARFGSKIESIPSAGKQIFISTCGNHCQGAIFKNGALLNSEDLLVTIEKLAREIPDFYFGRFDIRYISPEQLKLGKSLKVVEVNAAGAEATHIWDPQTKLLEAYRVLFEQWEHLFLIGFEIKRLERIRFKVRLFTLTKELLNLGRQEKSLSISS